ncbi:MAG: Monofunctional biosynthetic peptidoglycan transglycosylase [Anaerolineales bacterium]|nr:Monofunctional biosynthetic peptidoglycan transglycosylase [Anaerolineales bacterium]
MTDNDEQERIRRLLDSEAETRDDITPHQATGKRARVYSEPLSRPRLDANNMPLPRRVDEVDLEGTRVSNAAVSPPSRPLPPRPVAPPTPPISSFNWRGVVGCFVYGLIGLVFAGVVIGLIGLTIALYGYYSIARTLPSVEDLQARASQFETTRILDRNGAVLYEILDPNAGRRTYVPLDKISPYVVAATLATEDKDFYSHPGFDAWAIVRALWENYRTGGQGGGASTITQQLARALLLSPEERAERTIQRKAREIILAAEITRRYSKDEILELYLNEIYYGNLAYGIEAASETYFGVTADKLTLAQAAFLAGLPQSPGVYDIHTNRDVTLERNDQVLVLMYTLSQERACIEVSNSPAPVCVDATAATSASDEIRNYHFPQPDINIRYPHWVNYVRNQLELKYDAQTIYRSGFTIYTTLDPQLQNEAQRILSEQVALLADKNAFNGALVAIQPSSGQILAMVGSADFYNDAIAGQINMAVSQTRQPGSSIKPITYVAAFEKGWTPATLLWDVPSEFPPSGLASDPREPYKPLNYDGKFHGPVTVRVALANSFNVPAVKALNFVGIYDDPNTPEKDGMIAMAERLGITSLTQADYGLALTLGGGEVSLLDMTSAYAVFANNGVKIPPVSILKVTDFEGNLIEEYQPPAGEQALRPEHAYLISSILSDNEARSWMFGRNSVLNLPFPAAAKTGTSGTARGDAAELVFDNWTLGYTPDLVTGVWIGNADYSPMINTTGSTGAAPIWSQFMQYAEPLVSNGNPTPFAAPQNIIEKIVCSLTGAEPSPWCTGGQYREVFASDQPPLPANKDLFGKVTIDTWTRLEASPACDDFTEETNAMRVNDPWARKWLASGEGRNWLEANDLPQKYVYAPERECTANDPRPLLQFTNLKDGQVIQDDPVLAIQGVADATAGFRGWALDFRPNTPFEDWFPLARGEKPVKGGELYEFALDGVPNGEIILRLRLIGDNDAYAEKMIRLVIMLPLPPTPIPPTVTPSPTPTTIIVPSDTPTPSATANPPSPTATDTPPPPTETGTPPISTP